MTWLKQNLGIVITISVMVAGFFSGYSILQYRVKEIEERLNSGRLTNLQRAIDDDIDAIHSRLDVLETRVDFLLRGER